MIIKNKISFLVKLSGEEEEGEKLEEDEDSKTRRNFVAPSKNKIARISSKHLSELCQKTVIILSKKLSEF
jgi:hypothetical protein